MKERNINWNDLMITILLKWRTVFVAMVLGGILLGSISYVKSYRNMQQIKEQQENEVYEETFNEDEKANVDIVLRCEQVCEIKESYWNNSVLMQIDPLNVQKVKLTFLIKSEERDQSYNIEKIYEDLITGGDLFNWLREKCGIATNSVSELIELERSSDKQSDGSDSLSISVKHYDENVCKEMADLIVDYVNAQCETMQEALGTHEVLVVEQSLAVVSDSDLMEEQRKNANDIITLKTKITELKGKFSDKEYQYYDDITAEREEKDVEVADEISATMNQSPRVSFKYIVLGMMVAVFLCMFLMFWRYILNNKLRDIDNMEELYGIPHLGNIPNVDKEVGKVFGVIDRMILRLRDGNRRKYSQEEAIVLAANSVKGRLQKNTLREVNILTSSSNERLLDVCEKIAIALSKEGIRVEKLDCSVFDAKILNCLEDIQNAVLIAQAGDTFYNEVVQQIEILKQQQAKVLGGIIVEQ